MEHVSIKTGEVLDVRVQAQLIISRLLWEERDKIAGAVTGEVPEDSRIFNLHPSFNRDSKDKQSTHRTMNLILVLVKSVGTRVGIIYIWKDEG